MAAKNHAIMTSRGNFDADRAAVMATLIMTAKLNDIDPQAWLADVLARINDIPQGRLGELLPWEWRPIRSSELGPVV